MSAWGVSWGDAWGESWQAGDEPPDTGKRTVSLLGSYRALTLLGS